MYSQNPNDFMSQQILFQNQNPATTGEIYTAISAVLSGMNIPSTAEMANQVYCIIQPQLAEYLSRADQSRVNMEQHIEFLIKQHWAQVMQNEKLRKEKRSSIRRFTRDETGCGLCLEAGKENVKIGYIDIQALYNVRIEKDGTYRDYKYVTYLDSKKESRKIIIPLEKLSAKKLTALFKGFEFICSNSTIVNEYLAWCINTFPNPGNITIPEFPGFSILKINESEKAIFCCNDGDTDIELLEKCSNTFKSKIMPSGKLHVDEISSIVNTYLDTPEKIVLFSYGICGLLSIVLEDISYPIKQILAISSPGKDYTRQASYYLQTYNKEKDALSFNSNITTIRKMFHNAKDETIVLTDCTKIDDDERRTYVINEMLVLDSDEQSKPHNTAVLSTAAQYLIPPDQKICMSLSDDFYAYMTFEEEKRMCYALSLLTRYLIDIICQDYEKFKSELKDRICHVMQHGKAQELPSIQSKISYSVMEVVICMIGKYLTIPIDNMDISKYILDMFNTSTEVEGDNTDAITDEFVKLLNAKINSDKLSIVMHSKDMEFIQGKPQIIVKDDLILLEESTIAETLLPEMTTTESTHYILTSLYDMDLLHTTKKLRYPCTVYSKGMSIIVPFIAIKLHEVLNLDVQLKIQAKACEEWFSADSSEPSMMPIITNHLNYNAYRKYDFAKSDNLHCFITGESGSGKTHYLTEYTVTLHKAGQLVIVFDTSDSFTKESIIHNLSVGGNGATKKIVENYVNQNITFCDVEKDGVPVDILNLDYPVSSVTQKKIIQNIISANFKTMGKKQSAELSRCVENLMEHGKFSMVDLYEEITESNTSDSLAMQFEDILSAFIEYKLSDMSWGEYLGDKESIIIISSSGLSGTGGSALVDMLLMSLFYYQRNNHDRHIAVVIDEIQNQNCSVLSAIMQVIREGRKYHMSLNYATQYLAENNRERMKAMTSAGLKVYLRPDITSAKSIARAIGVTASDLTSMRQGECYVYGSLYNNTEHTTRPGLVHGYTYRNFVKPDTE